MRNFYRIDSLSNLTNLQMLWLDDNRISDISPLSSLTNLQHLGLENNLISNISPLKNLVNLMELRLSDNKITDIGPLTGLKKLTALSIDNNQISDITPLADLTQIGLFTVWEREGIKIHLCLSNNKISDISPLLRNKGLGEGDGVDLRGNPLSLHSINIVMPELQKRGVNVLYDLPGDTSGNSKITAYDASLTLRYLAGKEQLNEEQLRRADISQDGKVTIEDAILILLHVVGINPKNQGNSSFRN